MARITKKKTRLLRKCNGRCGYCGNKITYSSLHRDHIIPKARFYKWVSEGINIPEWLSHLTTLDLNHKDNIMPSCSDCNGMKGDLSLEDFRKELERVHLFLHKKNLHYRVAIKYNLINLNGKQIIFYYEKTGKTKA